MQGRWKKTADLLKTAIPVFIKKSVVPFILSLAGLSGVAWNFIVSAFLLKWWKKAEKEIDVQADIADKKEIDEENRKTYEQHITEGAPVETLIQDETNLLNGTKPK
jgi:hypothetical protein